MAYDPRLALIANPDGITINMVELGRIEQLDRCDLDAMTAEERAAHDAILEREDAGRVLLAASDAYCAHLDATVRKNGGTIVRERVRHGRVVSRTVERFPTRARSRTAPRARERRRGATRRAASSSTTSSADPPDADSEPPRRRGDLRHISTALTAFLLWLAGGAL